MVRFGDARTSPFLISPTVYRHDVWQPTLETFLPVQMCHIRRDRPRPHLAWRLPYGRRPPGPADIRPGVHRGVPAGRDDGDEIRRATSTFPVSTGAAGTTRPTTISPEAPPGLGYAAARPEPRSLRPRFRPDDGRRGAPERHPARPGRKARYPPAGRARRRIPPDRVSRRRAQLHRDLGPAAWNNTGRSASRPLSPTTAFTILRSASTRSRATARGAATTAMPSPIATPEWNTLRRRPWPRQAGCSGASTIPWPKNA